MTKISVLTWVPPFAQGLVREFRARWALEEAGLPYDTRALRAEDQASAAYRALQPFGQVPSLEQDGFSLFESGAVVLHIAEGCEALLPRDPRGRARAITWMFAALNTVEPPIGELAGLAAFHAGEDWAKQRRPGAEAAVQQRLDQLAAWLEGRDYLEDRFTAGDLLMVTVLRILRETELVSRMPVLDAYLRRCEARPAFGRALEAHMAQFAGKGPKDMGWPG